MSTQGFPTHLGNGAPIHVRPINRGDRAREVQIISRLSPHSRYLRFFTGAATVPDRVIDQLVDVDGYHHIAWGALDMTAPGAPLIGVVRAVRRGDSDEADLALAVLDAYHGMGLARLLLAAVAQQAMGAGIRTFTAETLHENGPARRLFKALGGKAAGTGGLVVTYRFEAAEVARRLGELTSGEAMDDLRAAFGLAPAPAKLERVA